MSNGPLIASRFSFRRVELKDAPIGALALFQPPMTDTVREPPSIALGIVTDGVDQKKAVRGVVWVGGGFEFISIDQVPVAAVLEDSWQILPDISRARFGTPQPGDLMISATEGMGLVHMVVPGRWGFLSLNSSIATLWRADRNAIVMPWSIVSGDDVIYKRDGA